MPSPSKSLSVPRPDLGQSMEEFDLAADRQGFIGYRVLPVIDTQLKAHSYGRIKLESLLQDRETKRNPRTGYNRGDWEFEDDSFTTQNHGVEEPIDDEDAKVYEDYFDAEVIATQRAYDAVQREAEKRVAAMIFNTSTWTGSSLTTAVSKSWIKANAATATPIDDVDAAADKIWNATGLWPNALVISRKVFKNLRKLDQIKDAIMSNGAGSSVLARRITIEMLAEAFDLDYVLVAGSAKSIANEAQTRSISSIWSPDYAMVCRIGTTNDLLEPCIGRVFHWTGRGSKLGGTIESYRDESIESDVIRCRHDVGEKVTYKECGHLLSGISTTG